MWCRNMFKADRLSQVTKRGCRHRWRAVQSTVQGVKYALYLIQAEGQSHRLVH